MFHKATSSRPVSWKGMVPRAQRTVDPSEQLPAIVTESAHLEQIMLRHFPSRQSQLEDTHSDAAPPCRSVLWASRINRSATSSRKKKPNLGFW